MNETNSDIEQSESEVKSNLPIPRRCRATRGFMWYFEAGDMVFSSFWKWMLASIGMVVVNVSFSLVPKVGDLITTLLSFLLMAVLLIGASQSDLKGRFQLKREDMMVLKEKAPRLIGLAFLMVVIMLVLGITIGVSAAMVKGGIAIVVPVVLSVIALLGMMMFWFAPALITFNDIKVIDALKSSSAAVFKNAFPLIIFMVVIIFVLALVGGLLLGFIPKELGTNGWGWLIREKPLLALLLVFMLGVIGAFSAAVNYVTYKDVFLTSEN